ncbi:MAG TPA: protein kinase [Candidatus Eisenbacteria bacterium]|nr:protein kinase [Candidatus Eisenbacteria bacterium]
MPLAPGARLGPYEIHGLLGAGGMGEVYRARDTRIGREVAVKVLPGAVAGDPERQQRFEAEARAAGSINHPNIITLHDVGVADGAPYLVTEILDGETLRAALGAGALTPQRATSLVAQAAQGLAAAHAHGIVHRDLKPENMFVLRDGRLKILDFGIAKATRTETTATMETTPVFASLTASGTILGTVSYMSPEQLRDQPVDHRADLFALGAILYELLTGRQAFTGATAADRVSAILVAEPKPLPAEVEGALPGIGAVVSRLLAKEPADRFASAADLAFTLGILQGRPAGAGGSEAAASAPDAGLGATARFKRLTFGSGFVAAARFAPDGQTVVYEAHWGSSPSDIFLTRIELPEARALHLPGSSLQGVSSTAEIAVTLNVQDLGGFVRSGTLARLPLVGGRSRELRDGVFFADWSPDGRSLAAILVEGGRTRIEAPLGTVIYESPGWMSELRHSPDGSMLAFMEHRRIGDSAGYPCIVRPGEEPRPLAPEIPNTARLAWTPDGREVWYGGQGYDNLIAVFAVDLEGRVRVVYSSPAPITPADISRDGDVLLLVAEYRMRLESGTRSGGAPPIELSALDWSLLRDASPDGSCVVFDETGSLGEMGAVYWSATDGTPPIRLGEGLCYALSPDGRHVLAKLRGPDRTLQIYPVGAGATRTIRLRELTPLFGAWLPDGASVVIVAQGEGGPPLLHRVDLQSGEARRISDVPVRGLAAIPSPDGAHVLSRIADGTLAIFPVAGGAPRPLPAAGANAGPCGWTADSRSIFVHDRNRIPAPVSRLEVDSGQSVPWMEIHPLHRSAVSGLNSVRVSRDGERYACSYVHSSSALYHARGLA